MMIGALPAKMVVNYELTLDYKTELFSSSDVPEEGEVKLYYNRYNADYSRGLLQVWLNGRWGTVKDSSWTIEDTNVVCRQLGRDGIKPLTECVQFIL